jgi:error-prone DNA polymerase
MQSLRRTRPENLDELAVQVAIIRPGPIQGGAVNPYIERRQRLREDPDYEPPCLHPSLAGVLRETLGTIIFQDQVLEVAQAFAGFGPGEADGLRRAMSRKRASVAIERYRRALHRGRRRPRRRPEALAQQVWEMVAGFAGFGFPKAHSAAFGLLAYQSTWLRVHYGPEFLCALLNEQPMGFYPPDSLAHEAQRRGIELRAVDVNASLAECTSRPNGAVRIGLGYVRGVHARRSRRSCARARRAGRSPSVASSRAGPGGAALARAARLVGACDALAGAPQRALGLGVAIGGRRVPAAPSSRCRSTPGRSPALRELGRWERSCSPTTRRAG